MIGSEKAQELEQRLSKLLEWRRDERRDCLGQRIARAAPHAASMGAR